MSFSPEDRSPDLPPALPASGAIARPLRRGAALLVLVLTTLHAVANSYPRLEAAFTLAGIASDPFDYAATDIKVQWRLPDNSTRSLPAFFDGGTTWRVRHTPTAAGAYAITGVTFNGSSVAFTALTATNWLLSGPANGAGFIRVDATDPKRFVTDNGRRFFPIGHNVCWNPSVSNDYPRIFSRMGAARENWTRIWMTHFYEGLNLDWPKVNGTFGQLNLTVARRWDLIVNEAEKAGIAMQIVLQHHGQYSTSVNANWNENPYNAANGGFLSDPTQFFTDPTAKALTKRKLRYAIARWGCSTSIMAWELWNEVQFTDAAYANQWTNIAAWHAEMAAFLRAQDSYGHLITTSSELSQDYWAAMDYYQNHNYANDMLVASRDPTGAPANAPVKPIFDGESSLVGAPQLWVHAPLWASLMSGQAGGSCPWWWDTIDPENDYFLFKSLSDYVSLTGLPNQNNLRKSAPKITGVPVSTLSFSPGGGWQPVTQDIFKVADSAPDGIGSATSFLHGSWHQSDMNMPNGYTFLVDYPQPGTFSVQVTETSTFGDSNFRLVIDGVTKTNVTFSSTTGGLTNVTFTTSVPAGAHSILLTNGALDWLVLGNIQLEPYIPVLGAYAVGNTNFQSAWVWHRTNLFLTNASTALSGQIQVTGLQAGNYAAGWWDCYNGGILTNFTLTVPTNGAVVPVNTPVILRSAALYVGQAAQAALIGPALKQTLITNAPPLFLALALTNSGGLPLNYSLSVTGLNAVTYSAMSSLQSQGPTYVWRDISAYGQNISGDFAPLAAPKAAGDEGIAGPFQIGFEFPFFSGAQSPGLYSQVYVSPNGFITFSPFAGDRGVNSALPGTSSPSNLVALIWDDLDLSAGGKIYVANDPLAGEFTVQYDAVRFKNSALAVTAQLVLRSTGEILCYYKSLGRTNSCTVGVQNAAATQGLQLTFNSAAYLQSGLAVRMSPAAWLQCARPAGSVPGGTAESLDFTFLPTGLATGVHTASLLIRTDDPRLPVFNEPVSLTIWDGQLPPLQQWQLSYFGTTNVAGNAASDADWDGDGLKNIFEYAFNTNPTNPNVSPLTYAITNDHFRLTFPRKHPAPSDITYNFEIATDLASGIWNSGPAYTTENSANNLDGTETATVTLNASIRTAPTSFVRLRISQP